MLVGALLSSAVLSPSLAQAVALPAPVSDPAALVDPFVGTGSGGTVVGQVDTFPGADAPFGMVQWSPDTPSRPDGGGYSYTDSSITGFSLTHVSGPGCAIGGDFPFLPLTGAIPADPDSATAAFSHSTETARPGYYAVTAGGVRTQLATTAYTGLGSFTYPATTQAQMLVKVADSAAGGSGATFQTSGDREITGAVTSGHFCGQTNSYTVYFAARFNQPFTASGTWGAQPTGTVSGGWLTFDTTKNPTVEMQVSVSYVSAQGALNNLAAKATSWSVPQVAAQTETAWNQQLDKISIRGGAATQQQTFYTALYHALLEPSLFSDADGSYIGFDDKVHRVQPGHAQYANYSGWDIYRSEVPLIATLDPGIAGDMMTSLLNDQAQGGSLPKWPSANEETGVMNGDSADPILADAYAFGATGFNARQALADMVHGADDSTVTPGQGGYPERPNGAAFIQDGYVPNVGSDSISPVPNGASETLEYALDDFAISRLAGDLGQQATAKKFTGTSQNWANIFDTANGYIEPRDAQGAFPGGPPAATTGGFGQDGFQEGNAAQYTWMVPQNLSGLISGMGGDQAAAARLDEYFTQLNVGPDEPYQWQGNEPSLDTPWAYDTVGQPWKTQSVVQQIMTQLYALTPGGEPGNDDLGAMSSWYVWAALGVYPQTPGVPMLVLGTPTFPQATIHGAKGGLTINARNAGDTYVQSLAVNGRPSQQTFVNLGQAHELDFTLGTSPNTRWGTGSGDAPPSYGAGPVSFPPSTLATVTAAPGQIRITPGGSTTVTVTAGDSGATAPATVTWQAAAPTGLTATPATATVTTPAGGSASTTVTIAASATIAPGYYQVAIQAHAANGAVIPQTSLLVTVAQPGQSIPTAYVSNYSDNTVTPVDTNTLNAGPPIPVGSGPDGMITTGGELFVANNNSNNVTVINTSTNAVVATVPVGSIAADVAPTPDGKTVWVSNFGDGTVQPIDTATLTAGTPVTVGGEPERLAISPDGSRLWVANQGDGTVSVVDLATDTVVHTIAVGAAPFGVAFTPDGSKVFISNGGSSSVSVISTATDTVLATVPVGAGPQYVAVSPDGATAYVADSGAGGVTPITVATDTAGPFIPTGSGAYAVGFSPDGATAWAIDSNVDQAVPIDVATGVPGTPVTVGDVPDGVVVTG